MSSDFLFNQPPAQFFVGGKIGAQKQCFAIPGNLPGDFPALVIEQKITASIGLLRQVKFQDLIGMP